MKAPKNAVENDAIRAAFAGRPFFNNEKVQEHAYNPTQARWPKGTPVGGQWKDKDTMLDDQGIVHTDDVDDAAKALALGMQVELRQPYEVAVLMKKLAEQCRECVEGKRDVIDLCSVTVKGTNIFCVHNKGIPRVQMPQLAGFPTPGSKADFLPRDPVYGGVDLAPKFKEYLITKGINVEETRELVSHLRATQRELDGRKVASIARSMVEGKSSPDAASTWVSRDNYIVDGHHRWAANIGLAATKGNLDAMTVPVTRVQEDIIPLLKLANEFAASWGIPQSAMAKFMLRCFDVDQLDGYPGVWRTIRGRRVFIRDGEDVDKALERSLKGERDVNPMRAHDDIVPEELHKDIELMSTEVLGGMKDKESAGDLVALLGKSEHKQAMLDMIDKSPEDKRSFVLLHRGDEAKGIPTVWLLGWSNKEGTDLHDHAASEVGVHVLRGKIIERSFVPVTEGLSMRDAAKREQGMQIVTTERQFRAGSTMTIGNPYIHDVFGTDEKAHSDVTVHAYWPPLREMGYYKFTNKDRIKWDGRWREGEIDPDAARRHSCMMCARVEAYDFNPTQPRHPKGTPLGGQWKDEEEGDPLAPSKLELNKHDVEVVDVYELNPGIHVAFAEQDMALEAPPELNASQIAAVKEMGPAINEIRDKFGVGPVKVSFASYNHAAMSTVTSRAEKTPLLLFNTANEGFKAWGKVDGTPISFSAIKYAKDVARGVPFKEAYREYVRGTVIHEMGHVLDTNSDIMSKKLVESLRKSGIKDRDMPRWAAKNISTYAGTNVKDAFAEAFNMYMVDKKLPKELAGLEKALNEYSVRN